MKKTLGALLISVALLAGLFTTTSEASAQSKGAMTLGLSGGYAGKNNGGYASLFFMYQFARHVRIAPEIAYVFRNEGKSAFTMDIDMQFPWAMTRGVNVYPLAGVAFNNWTFEGGGNATRVGLDLGGGFDINMTPQLKLTLQAKYTLMNDMGGVYAGMGIGYNF